VLLWRVPGNVVGGFLVVLSIFIIGAQFSYELGSPYLSGLAFELFLIGAAGVAAPSLAYFMLTFPTGRVYPPRLAPWVKIYALVKFAGAILEIMASSTRIKIFTLPANPLFIPTLAPYRSLIAATIGITGILLPLSLLAGMASLLLRYRVSPARERQQIKWVVWASGVVIVAVLIAQASFFSNPAANIRQLNIGLLFIAITQLLFLAAIAIAILRYHLFDIDLIINRTLVYGSLTVIVVGLYALVVGYLSEFFHSSDHFTVSLLATGLIAVLFQPLRQRLQQGVNRLLYGERDDPYGVLSRLGQRLETTLAPEAVLPAMVETIAQALKLPYAAVALKQQHSGADNFAIAAAYGSPVTPLLHLPLVYQAETIGQLIVAARAPGESFTAPERRLLENIARQASVAAHAVRLTTDLQRARERLVTAREEERRRLRRDLHDGLGPQLAGQTLKLEAARDSLSANPEKAEALLNDLIGKTQNIIVEVRRLVYALRPPALDDLGLVAALREHAAQSELDGAQVTLSAPEHLPALPAAVEVAAYRIVQEALTNVVRHAHAQNCFISLDLRHTTGQMALSLEISDDGIGLSPEHQAGVGLSSMRERAEELGGECLVEALPGGGTRVTASLPIARQEN
ncbi:MAG: sensor histidine kinase, partial [Chloroflexi bacterium]|nr:sensor histidine kinase [Chloroflexota bacterium]